MQVESSTYPNQFEINYTKNGKAKVLLRDNITESQVENEDGTTNTIYQYDEVKVELVNRSNLEQYIENNFSKLFNAGLEDENTSEKPSLEKRVSAIEEAVLEDMGV